MPELTDGTMESVGGTGQTAQAQGQSYEAITDQLKAEHPETESADETAEPSAEPVEESPKATPPTAPSDDLATFEPMTDEQIASLPPELQTEAKALRKRFQAAYTRKTMDLAAIRKQAEFAAKFESDPTFRAQMLAQRGFVPQATTPPTPPAPAEVTTAPPEYVERRRSTLPPELQWLADSLALGDYKLHLDLDGRVKAQMAPLQQTIQSQQAAAIQGAFDREKAALSERHPGWEAQEDAMADLARFFQSRDLTHPVFGSKLALLHRLATASGSGDTEAAATAQKVIERTAAAVKSGSVTSHAAGRSTAPNIEERVQKAKTDRDAWDEIRKATAR